jgi:hypothetical protein
MSYEESVEMELSASGVNRFVKAFDYTDQEWTEIELPVQSARLGPLTEEARQRLRLAAGLYLALHSTGRQFLRQQELSFAENWARIGKLAAELYEQLDCSLRGFGDRQYRGLRKSLRKLQNNATLSAKSPLLSSREEYYREIFGVWIDTLGGRLGVSRDAGNHKLGGPLVRFFQAVTYPVLAAEAPAVESISGIVDREKERRKKRRKRGETAPGQVAGSEPASTSDREGYLTYTDLGPFRIDHNIPFERQVHDYCVERGRATGVQHFVAIDTGGTVLAHASGARYAITFPEKLTLALHDPNNKIVIHISNQSAGLNTDDIGCLGFPGLEAIWRHSHGGSVARGALTPDGRAMLRGNTLEEARCRLLYIAYGVGDSFYEVLEDAFRTGRISYEPANTVYSHLICLTLCRAGILDYRFESARGRQIAGLGRTQDWG